MKLALISDTHGHHAKLGIPLCDVLIHSGDFSRHVGTFDETHEFLIWMEAQPAKHKILVPGNHDVFCEKSPVLAHEMAARRNIHFLIDEHVEIDGLKFWGSPYTPIFYDWSFMVSSEELRWHWSRIPNDTDVLITHGPPMSVGDQNDIGVNSGDSELLARVLEFKPKLHIFGHIHEGRGEYRLGTTRFINAASITRYIHPPVMVEVE